MASSNIIFKLLDSNFQITRALISSDNLTEARQNLFTYLNNCEAEVLKADCKLHPLEKKNVRDCINVFKNIISESNEEKSNHSCLNTLWKLATEHGSEKEWPGISDAFLMEMIHLFKGVVGLSEIYSKSGICKREIPAFINMEGLDAAISRSELLNEKAGQYLAFIRKNNYKSGLEPEVIQARELNKKAVLDLLDGTEEDWHDYRWQMKQCFNNPEQIGKIIDLTATEKACISDAVRNKVPFGITPFYLSLMERKRDALGEDRSIRTHVIPSRNYLDRIIEQGSNKREALDFMRETDTSPVELITRRYPMIAIIKPFCWCPQICVYCQRNWELSDTDCNEAVSSEEKLKEAFAWFRNNPEVNEVLITGGDPLSLKNEEIEYLLQTFSKMEHIKRIRIGTRTLVTMPMRFDGDLLRILQKYHRPPYQILSIVTHVQHAYEISREMAEMAGKIKLLGIDIYNQQVFTMQNCRKFETCFLRENLKAIGIIPYYLFNLKDKDETMDFKVPLARLLQEQKEEARLLPGMVRTDKPVFNLPTLGKNNLNSWQDHDLIMIHDDGSRVYEFYPWEKYMAPVNTFLFRDEPIYDFLKKIEDLGENLEDYRTIWYYF